MSEEGTIYIYPGSPRSALLEPLVKYLNLDIEVLDKNDPNFLKAFPLHKAPSFLSKDGWKLHEVLAVLEYLVSLKPDDKYKFFGEGKRERAQVFQWLSFTNTDFLTATGTYAFRSPTPEAKAAALVVVERNVDEFEQQLKKTPYLVGSQATLADLFAANFFAKARAPFDKAWFAKHPALEKWFKKIADTDPVLSPVLKGTFQN
ncbi:DEKNAAC101394 [Brettanomyces naardenensis]|uniref:DEKNAAC101394 n=1 Tax=Brettanomyces naardenensis TaxID=13370 RepID=A0A448YHX0_BRENA|nr:DEKNAAC101394 [Brettanomyces naardenensis]